MTWGAWGDLTWLPEMKRKMRPETKERCKSNQLTYTVAAPITKERKVYGNKPMMKKSQEYNPPPD